MYHGPRATLHLSRQSLPRAHGNGPCALGFPLVVPLRLIIFGGRHGRSWPQSGCVVPSGPLPVDIERRCEWPGCFSGAASNGITPDRTAKLLAALETEDRRSENESDPDHSQALVEPLSRRELEVLHLVAQGLSNHEISERLFLALTTVKGHNLRIFEKLQVRRRTEAVVRARELGLLE